MVAMHAGKAECRLRHSPTPQEIKNHSDRESASSVREDIVPEDFLIKENSDIIEEEHETDERVKQHWNCLRNLSFFFGMLILSSGIF